MVWVFLFVLFSFFKEISCHVWILLVYFLSFFVQLIK